MVPVEPLAPVRPASRHLVARLLQLLFHSLRSRGTLTAFLFGSAIATLLRLVFVRLSSIHRLWRSEQKWRSGIDFCTVQGCVMTTEHLASLGRVEKRTLFITPVETIFPNEYFRRRVLQAARLSARMRDPVTRYLTGFEKWHCLNLCRNYCSGSFGAHHIFFNEARRVKSTYKSCWYCMMLTCSQTSSSGRWFVTPYHPVVESDFGVLRLRIVLINEKELRSIASGDLQPPEAGLFNGRHQERWDSCLNAAECFERQLSHSPEDEPAANASAHHETVTLSGPAAEAAAAAEAAEAVQPRAKSRAPSDRHSDGHGRITDSEPDAILRIHIPFPAMSYKECRYKEEDDGRGEQAPLGEAVCQDVVLYE